MNFKVYAENMIDNANSLAEGLKKEGFNLVSGGTDNHLLLLDVRSLGITGKVAEKVLDEVGITVNKNTIPLIQKNHLLQVGSVSVQQLLHLVALD